MVRLVNADLMAIPFAVQYNKGDKLSMTKGKTIHNGTVLMLVSMHPNQLRANLHNRGAASTAPAKCEGSTPLYCRGSREKCQ